MSHLATASTGTHVEAFRCTGSSPGRPRASCGTPSVPLALDRSGTAQDVIHEGTPPVPLLVLKFGSSLLEGPPGFSVAAAEVAREVAAGSRVVAVCSARRGVTDALLAEARILADEPPPDLVSRVLASGEAASVPLLALALAARGVAAHALDAATLGIRTRGPLLDAEPVELDAGVLHTLLGDRPVLVVPGFVGVHETGDVSLLGRGGSDLTALFLAHRLGAAECRLVKDVDGIYPSDPDLVAGQEPFRYASWDTARAVGGGVVQTKAVHLAQRWNQPFRVAAPGGVGTWVADGEVPLSRPERAAGVCGT